MTRERGALLGLSSKKSSAFRVVDKHSPCPKDLTQPIPAPHDGRNEKAAVGWCIPEALVDTWPCVLETFPLLQL